MRLHGYVFVPTEAQHRQAVKRLRPFTRCISTVARDGLARAKPVSCFGAGNRLRYRAGKRAVERWHEAKEQGVYGRDILRRITDLCTITSALAAATSAAEGLLCVGARDESGGLVVDEGEALKVRAAIAWAQELARAKRTELGS